MAFVFRADDTNVGDWYSPPFRYFPFRPNRVFDILDRAADLSKERVVVVGGGGLGRTFFRSHLKKLKSKKRKYILIAWGVGVDDRDERNKILKPEFKYELFGDWFDDFDEVGIRVYSDQQKFRYVPCASCLHDDFFQYRNIKPKKLIGLYNHKRVPLRIKHSTDGLEVNNNSGSNLRAKLEFISKFEFIVTNTYHGIYWATLLNRKVICLPFKSGCFSFKFPPIYSSGDINDDILHAAKAYPEALEDSRKSNLEYYSYLLEKYGDF